MSRSWRRIERSLDRAVREQTSSALAELVAALEPHLDDDGTDRVGSQDELFWQAARLVLEEEGLIVARREALHAARMRSGARAVLRHVLVPVRFGRPAAISLLRAALYLDLPVRDTDRALVRWAPGDPLRSLNELALRLLEELRALGPVGAEPVGDEVVAALTTAVHQEEALSVVALLASEGEEGCWLTRIRIVAGPSSGDVVHLHPRSDGRARMACARALVAARSWMRERLGMQLGPLEVDVDLRGLPARSHVEGDSLALPVALALLVHLFDAPPLEEIGVTGALGPPETGTGCAVMPVGGQRDKIAEARRLTRLLCPADGSWAGVEGVVPVSTLDEAVRAGLGEEWPTEAVVRRHREWADTGRDQGRSDLEPLVRALFARPVLCAVVDVPIEAVPSPPGIWFARIDGAALVAGPSSLHPWLVLPDEPADPYRRLQATYRLLGATPPTLVVVDASPPRSGRRSEIVAALQALSEELDPAIGLRISVATGPTLGAALRGWREHRLGEVRILAPAPGLGLGNGPGRWRLGISTGAALLALGSILVARPEEPAPAWLADLDGVANEVERHLSAGDVDAGRALVESFAEDARRDAPESGVSAHTWLMWGQEAESRGWSEESRHGCVRALRDAEDPGTAHAARLGIARSFRDQWDWPRLARSLLMLEQDGPEEGALRADLALAGFDLAGATAQLEPGSSVRRILTALAPAELLDATGGRAVWLPDQRALLVIHSHAVHLVRSGDPTRMLLSSNGLAWIKRVPRFEARDGVILQWRDDGGVFATRIFELRLDEDSPSLVPLGPPFDASCIKGATSVDLDGDGRAEVYLGEGDPYRRLLRVDPAPGGWTVSPDVFSPALHHASSDLFGVLPVDLDGEDPAELLVASGRWRFYGLAIVDRAGTVRWRSKLGSVTGLADLGDGRFATATEHSAPSYLVNPAERAYGAGAAVHVFRMADGEPRLEQVVPLPIPSRVSPEMLAVRAGDLDGDGYADLVAGFSVPGHSGMVLSAGTAGGLSPAVAIEGCLPQEVADLDQDGDSEVLVHCLEGGGLWALGTGSSVLPTDPVQPVELSVDLPEPDVEPWPSRWVHRWELAKELAELALHDEAAEAYESMVVRMGTHADVGYARLWAGAMRGLAGDREEARAHLLAASELPAVAEVALRLVVQVDLDLLDADGAQEHLRALDDLSGSPRDSELYADLRDRREVEVPLPGSPGSSWEIRNSAAVRAHDDGVTVTAVSPSARPLTLPLRRTSGPIGLRARLTVHRVEWGSRIDLGISGRGQRGLPPLHGLAIGADGGGGFLNRFAVFYCQPSCTSRFSPPEWWFRSIDARPHREVQELSVGLLVLRDGEGWRTRGRVVESGGLAHSWSEPCAPPLRGDGPWELYLGSGWDNQPGRLASVTVHDLWLAGLEPDGGSEVVRTAPWEAAMDRLTAREELPEPQSWSTYRIDDPDVRAVAEAIRSGSTEVDEAIRRRLDPRAWGGAVERDARLRLQAVPRDAIGAIGAAAGAAAVLEGLDGPWRHAPLAALHRAKARAYREAGEHQEALDAASASLESAERCLEAAGPEEPVRACPECPRLGSFPAGSAAWCREKLGEASREAALASAATGDAEGALRHAWQAVCGSPTPHVEVDRLMADTRLRELAVGDEAWAPLLGVGAWCEDEDGCFAMGEEVCVGRAR